MPWDGAAWASVTETTKLTPTVGGRWCVRTATNQRGTSKPGPGTAASVLLQALFAMGSCCSGDARLSNVTSVQVSAWQTDAASEGSLPLKQLAGATCSADGRRVGPRQAIGSPWTAVGPSLTHPPSTDDASPRSTQTLPVAKGAFCVAVPATPPAPTPGPPPPPPRHTGCGAGLDEQGPEATIRRDLRWTQVSRYFHLFPCGL